MTVLATAVPSFAIVEDCELLVDTANIKLTVEYGGIAFFGTQEYTPGTYDIDAFPGDTIEAYSNAGYKCVKEGNIYVIEDNDITVEFDAVALNVMVIDGNAPANMKLVEVDFYDNTVNVQTFPNSPDSNPVTFTTTIPALESELVEAGFVKTTDAANKIFTKTLIYDLVDRYNGNDAAAILAQATADLVVRIKHPTNLWVASDEYSELYVNGVSVTDNSPSGHCCGTVQEYYVDAAETPFIAAQAWDTQK